MVKKATKKKRMVSQPEVVEVIKDVCSICHGRGFTEENAGFTQRKCVCGTLSIHERILIRADEALRDSGGEDTLQSPESEEPETPEGVSEGDSEVLPEIRDSVSVSEDSDNLQ